MRTLIELVAYAFINSVLIILMLEPMWKILIIKGESSAQHVIYGITGLVVASVFAVVWGIAFALLFTRVQVEIQNEEEKEYTENEKEEKQG